MQTVNSLIDVRNTKQALPIYDVSCSSDRITELAPFLSDFRSKDELGSASDREESCAIRHAEKLSKVYSEAPFEDKREPDADCEQSDG